MPMIFDEPSREPLPKTPDLNEVGYVALKGVASLVPGGGDLFGLLTSPLAKRRDAWLEDLERRLHDLEGHVATFRFEDLANNEQFISATLQATQTALRTHQKEKLEALRSAVLNIALGKEPETDRQTLFLALIDRFTVYHLSVFRAFADPQKYCQQRHIPVPKVEYGWKMLATELVNTLVPGIAETAKSPVAGRDGTLFQMADLVLSDLEAANLIALDRHQQTWSVPRFSSSPNPVEVKPLITHLGEDFLAFITEPAEDAK